MKRNIYNLLLVSAIATACLTGICTAKVKMIPEISNALCDEILGGFIKDANIAETVIVRDSNFIFFTLTGKIYRFNFEKKVLDFLVNLDTPIEPPIIYQKDTVVLKDKNSGNFIFFDLRQMSVIEIPQEINAEKIICVDAEHQVLGYLKGGRLVFMNYMAGKTLAESNIADDKGVNENGGDEIFFNSAVTGINGMPELFVLSSRALYIFNNEQSSLDVVKLESKACSGFLADDGVIYYGSENRELIQFSLADRKVQWRFKLADRLKIEPRKAGPYIVITPEDHNIYFFNKRGTLYWWEKLDSTRLLPPVVMKENVAVFLWNKTIKFFDYKHRTSYIYPLDKVVFSDALHIDGYLYVIAETGVQDQGQPLKAIIKIGNNFGIVIQTDPQNIIPVGRSIKFNLERFNLIKPELKVNILDTENNSVFTKIISYKEDASFIWIPNRAATYRLVVEINAENKKNLIIEHPFEVIDVETLLLQYYYRLQKNSNEEPIVHSSSRQDSVYPTESAKIKKNEKARAVPERKKN